MFDHRWLTPDHAALRRKSRPTERRTHPRWSEPAPKGGRRRVDETR
ncbi:MAG: hypothetical protein H0T04_01255 [Chloroflexi bacterium]|jgi:hypothetical protein|nr:hypothetical protein [Chloroflexota bacterium]